MTGPIQVLVDEVACLQTSKALSLAANFFLCTDSEVIVLEQNLGELGATISNELVPKNNLGLLIESLAKSQQVIVRCGRNVVLNLTIPSCSTLAVICQRHKGISAKLKCWPHTRAVRELARLAIESDKAEQAVFTLCLHLDLLFDPRQLHDLGDFNLERVPIVAVLVVAADQLGLTYRD